MSIISLIDILDMMCNPSVVTNHKSHANLMYLVNEMTIQLKRCVALPLGFTVS